MFHISLLTAKITQDKLQQFYQNDKKIISVNFKTGILRLLLLLLSNTIKQTSSFSKPDNKATHACFQQIASFSKQENCAQHFISFGNPASSILHGSWNCGLLTLTG